MASAASQLARASILLPLTLTLTLSLRCDDQSNGFFLMIIAIQIIKLDYFKLDYYKLTLVTDDKDIWHHIHSLMPMHDAARAACLSKAFLCFWRRHPNLILTKDTIGLNASACGGNFSRKIDYVLKNHSGIGVKIFRLEYVGVVGFDASRYLESWFQLVKPGIEELTLKLCKTEREYNFPCSLLSSDDGIQNSIRLLNLSFCAFHPTAELSPLRSLTGLRLSHVNITGKELQCFLSNSPALEQLHLFSCMGIICLKIPCSLQKLNYLCVFGCFNLKVLENKAPNLSGFYLREERRLKLSLGDTSHMKKLNMEHMNLAHYVRAVLPPIMPNLETLYISSGGEVIDTPMLPTKFLYLKHLTICFPSGLTFSPSYDYFSLVSFLDASPSLETFILDMYRPCMKQQESVFKKSPDWRQIPENRHDNLKSVKITGFSSAKSLVELTYYILKNMVSLESLTLDTIYGNLRCYLKPFVRCDPMSEDTLMEAPRALSAIRTYIENKVPSTVKLTVLEPCSQCHAKGLKRILC
uniref:At1g61320/AtMIF1 LRR domain-containing protein n=1 Tax=Oryza brachyantha TaxID=4533 RepID=J3MA04_ORYBR